MRLVEALNKGTGQMTKPTIASLQAEHKKAITELHTAMTEAMDKSQMYAKETAYVKQQLDTAEKAFVNERKAHNLTRDVLHSTELELARMRGYIDGQSDNKPPVMVPEAREARLASYSDGTRSLPPTSGTWADNAARSPWWHK